MTRTLITWMCILVAAFLVGPAAGWLAGSLRAPDGGTDASGLLSQTPLLGLAKMIGVVLLAGGMGVAAARVVSARTGLFCAGLVLAWGAWRAGRVDEILRAAQSPAPLWTLSIEAAVLGAAALIAGLAILKAGRADQRDRADGVTSRSALVGMAVALAVGGVAAFVVAKGEMVGQTFAAACAAGLFGATVGRAVRHSAPMASFLAAGAVLAVAGPAAGALASGGHVIFDLYSGHLLPLARPMPLDWLAGVFIGVPIGASWAASMVEHHHHSQAGSPV